MVPQQLICVFILHTQERAFIKLTDTSPFYNYTFPVLTSHTLSVKDADGCRLGDKKSLLCGYHPSALLNHN
jgi:hypothetical protein